MGLPSVLGRLLPAAIMLLMLLMLPMLPMLRTHVGPAKVLGSVHASWFHWFGTFCAKDESQSHFCGGLNEAQMWLLVQNR